MNFKEKVQEYCGFSSRLDRNIELIENQILLNKGGYTQKDKIPSLERKQRLETEMAQLNCFGTLFVLEDGEYKCIETKVSTKEITNEVVKEWFIDFLQRHNRIIKDATEVNKDLITKIINNLLPNRMKCSELSDLQINGCFYTKENYLCEENINWDEIGKKVNQQFNDRRTKKQKIYTFQK